ncbi:MAG: transporter substrate-binding domain-containing protein, partial [Desulfobacterales bacterium]
MMVSKVTLLIKSILVAFGGLLVALSSPVDAETDRSVLVGISPIKPFVIISDDTVEGFCIDLWHEVARELNLDYVFVRSVGISGTLEDVVEKRVDAAIGGLAINSDREQQIDFTHAYFNSGLGILVPRSYGLSIGPLFKSFLTANKLVVIISFLLLMVIAGHIIWFIERDRAKGRRSFSPNYFPGVIEGIYWAVVTASTVGYGDRVARSWYGRLLTLVLIVIALPVFGYFIATLSSNITLQKLRSTINGPQDLVARRVGVLDGSTSQKYMQQFKARLYAFDRIDDAYQWLINGRLDAVVYDRPNLQYYARHEGQGEVEVVGRTFAPQDYGIAIPP